MAIHSCHAMYLSNEVFTADFKVNRRKTELYFKTKYGILMGIIWIYDCLMGGVCHGFVLREAYDQERVVLVSPESAADIGACALVKLSCLVNQLLSQGWPKPCVTGWRSFNDQIDDSQSNSRQAILLDAVSDLTRQLILYGWFASNYFDHSFHHFITDSGQSQ